MFIYMLWHLQFTLVKVANLLKYKAPICILALKAESQMTLNEIKHDALSIIYLVLQFSLFAHIKHVHRYPQNMKPKNFKAVFNLIQWLAINQLLWGMCISA